jgi:hypothetical protein
MCFDEKKRQPGSPVYLLDQGDSTTKRLDWTALSATLDRFEQEAGQFFQLCVTDHFHQAHGTQSRLVRQMRFQRLA